MKNNWVTTLGGLIATIGIGLQTQEDPALKSAGLILAGVGGLIVAVFAKDSV